MRNQIADSPATCLNTWKAEHHRKILFSLEEKEIGRAQNKKSKECFSVVWRACRAVAGLASLLGVLLKKCSNFVQKTPQKSTRIAISYSGGYSCERKRDTERRSATARYSSLVVTHKQDSLCFCQKKTQYLSRTVLG
ncbi:MAG: hypothetical protein EOM84_00605 [Sphingobacteriia bacterium]|nr:hypothetical protein [Sphingobacteriia bacterium]